MSNDAHAASGTLTVSVLRAGPAEKSRRDDRVVIEAPLEFQLHHPAFGAEPVSFGTTMRTPGDDESLAVGLLYGEGIINSAADIDAVESSTRRPNVVNVRLQPAVEVIVQAPARRFSAGSSCGVCGTTGLDAAIARAAASHIPDRGRMPLELLLQLPPRMRAHQQTFGDTGGVHACAAFDFDGTFLASAEDVGRHNAMDKLVGSSLMSGALPLHDRVVLLSGRASFELTQKAIRAGVAILASIGAPSSLAVKLAEATGLTLAGFVRDTHCNVYAHAQRLLINSPDSHGPASTPT